MDIYALTLKAPRKTASEKCCLFMSSVEYSCKLLKATGIPANTVDPDQTAPKILHCLQKWLLKSQAEDKADDNCCDWRFKG